MKLAKGSLDADVDAEAFCAAEVDEGGDETGEAPEAALVVELAVRDEEEFPVLSFEVESDCLRVLSDSRKCLRFMYSMG